MQNNYNPNYQYGYQANNGGYAYSVARPQPSNSQPLTQDIANTLKQESAEVNMKVDQRDIWRAICTHRDPSTGASTLTHNTADGTCTCSICGETFHLFDGTKDDIEAAVNTIIDMFQTCKTIYMDAPVEMTKQYYQQITLLRKFPALWEHAIKNFAKYENVNNPLNPISNGYGGFNALSTLLTNPYAMQQPNYGYQPMMGGYAPNGQPMIQQPMAVGFNVPNQQMNPYAMQQTPMAVMDPNPMGYNATPMAPIPGVVPGAQTAQQPAAPAATPAPSTQNNEVQQQKVYNV